MTMIYPSLRSCGGDDGCKFFDFQEQDDILVSICNIVNRPVEDLGECPWEKYKLNIWYSLCTHKVECYDRNYTIVVDLKELD